MRILFDHCTSAPLRRHLTGHIVDTADERSWSRLRNGNLLDAAESEGYDLLITTDQDIRYQQNFSHRRIALLIIQDNSWPRIQRHIDDVRAAISRTNPGQFATISISGSR